MRNKRIAKIEFGTVEPKSPENNVLWLNTGDNSISRYIEDTRNWTQVGGSSSGSSGSSSSIPESLTIQNVNVPEYMGIPAYDRPEIIADYLYLGNNTKTTSETNASMYMHNQAIEIKTGYNQGSKILMEDTSMWIQTIGSDGYGSTIHLSSNGGINFNEASKKPVTLPVVYSTDSPWSSFNPQGFVAGSILMYHNGTALKPIYADHNGTWRYFSDDSTVSFPS